MTRAKRTRAKGFTLVELLIVIVIIGVLAGLLTPALLSAQAKARSAGCKSNLRQIYIALETYRNDNDGIYPYAADVPSLNLNNLPRISDVLATAAGNARVFRCSADKMGYFERNGSSYEYDTRLGGKQALQGRFATILGETRTPAFYDYEDFHGVKGTVGSRNYVFVDGHVDASLPQDTQTVMETGP